MKILRSKTAAIAIALFLISAFAISLVATPAVNAHSPPMKIQTRAFIVALPNPVGVGQTTLLYLFLDQTYDAATVFNDYRFRNYQLTITAPNGNTITKTFSYISDPTSNQGYSFTPDQVGKYTLFFSYPGQNINDYDHAIDDFVNDTYLPSSATTTLTVQQSPISTYPGSYPLPTEYWTRPIYGENPGWWTISSNWLGTGAPVLSSVGTGDIAAFSSGFTTSLIQRYPGDAVGPQTSHVMWTKPLHSGGVVGGNIFPNHGDTYFEGSAYNQRFTNPIILNGRLYYTEPVSFTGTTAGPTDCVDLRTGKIIWSRNDVPALSFGYVYDVQDENQHGVYQAILFTSNFARAFDADTGDQLFNVTGVPSGYEAMGPQGEHLRYVMTNLGTSGNPNWVLAQWNSSRLWGYEYPPYLSPTLTNASGTGTWSMTGSTVSITFIVNASIFDSSNANNRYDWNVSIPWRNTMPSAPTVLAAFYNNMLICYNGSLPSYQQRTGFSVAPYTYFAVNLNASKGPVGSVLWWNTVTPTANDTVNLCGADPTAGVFIEEYKGTLNFGGYSMATGQKLWTTPSQTALDYYGSPAGGVIASQLAYGKLYASGYAGIIYCYDLKTGNILWTYGNGGAGNSTESGFEVPGHYPTFINAVGNGVLYTVTSEHTIETPIYKGALARAINATDGTEIWTLSDYTTEFAAMSYAIADGFATFFNGYDSQIYSVGRGPSATTVQALLNAITAGSSAVIQGTVIDISAGTKQDQQAAEFPYGVPAVSDASMTDWMGYVYQQKPHPASATGVTVTLDAIDPNNNFIHLGTATSDMTGLFSYAWTTPDVPGKYTVIATFPGTNGYWPSYAETAMYVSEAPPSPTPTPALALPPDTTLTIIGTGIAIIIAVAIVGIMLARLLRKRA